jgi:AcrR family transcriptional regulator
VVVNKSHADIMHSIPPMLCRPCGGIVHCTGLLQTGIRVHRQFSQKMIFFETSWKFFSIYRTCIYRTVGRNRRPAFGNRVAAQDKVGRSYRLNTDRRDMAPHHPQIEKDTKAKIFVNAARLFAEKGYNGVSMREISERSAVSKPTIYYYFGSKEGIYRQLLDEGIRHCTGHFREIQSLNLPVREKLVLIVDALFEDAFMYPDLTKFFINLFMISENLDFLGSYHADALDQTQVIMEVVKDGVAKGELSRETDPALIAEILVGTVTHLIWHQTLVKKRILTKALSEKIVQSMFTGIQNGKSKGGIHEV